MSISLASSRLTIGAVVCFLAAALVPAAVAHAQLVGLGEGGGSLTKAVVSDGMQMRGLRPADRRADDVRADDARADDIPVVAREFRGVWVASVANIDWPSKPGLTTQQQKLELLEILDRATALRLNAVIFQVRPAADALYDSSLEPWSEYLTGRMGQAPSPYYDPLEFAVTEAHRRGLELHAWFNPYRARDENSRTPASATHISKVHPELVKRYGGFLWMDPGEPAVQQQSLDVILDVVRRYDVDGVHIDDYFYPYRIAGQGGRGYVQFPDDVSWARYQRAGGKLVRDDWRRDNVDRFIERLYSAVKKEKPWVKFGISPFGIWRPGSPESVRGLDAYTELYADSRKWIRNGWLDYLAPQLYWPVGAAQQSYPALLRWWVEQNAHARHIWPGNFTSRVGERRQPAWTPAELVRQVRLTRAQPGAGGNIHFSMKALLTDVGRIVGPLRDEVYSEPALVPASPWLERRPAPGTDARVIGIAGGTVHLTLRSDEVQRVRTWIVRAQYGSRWQVMLVPGVQRDYYVENDRADGRLPDRILVSAVDRVGVEGPQQAVTTVVRAAGH